MLRTLAYGDEIEVLEQIGTWSRAKCLSVGYSDIIAEFPSGGTIMIPRTEPKRWRFAAPISKD